MVHCAADVERFWSRVQRGDGCWRWRGKGRVGSKTGPKYGSLVFDGQKQLAHRVAYQLQKGPIPTDKPFVLHHCDDPLCMRGAHLWAGTKAQNSADMVAKGRQSRGTARHNAILNPGKVRRLRARYAAGESPTALATEYGITLRGAWRVIKREHWTWV